MTDTDSPSGLPLIIDNALRGARLKSVPSGQILFYENDLPQEVLVVKSGIVKIYDIDEDGNEKILHLVKPPAVVPFSYFSGMKDPLRWLYATLTDCELYTIPYKDFKNLTVKNRHLADMLDSGFSNDVHELLVRLSSLGRTNSHDKVVAALKFLVALHSEKVRGQWWQVTFPVSHQLIADLCGITREGTTLAMKDLSDNGVVRSPKQTVLEINKSSLG